MHEENIETLRFEAQRLIDMEIDLLNKMMAEPNVISAARKDEVQSFDRDTTPKYIEVLKGERTKLDDLEMVLAVVGTMKAGKSTSINAIVGTEVLPNRNRPMTALPTLIRHTSGQIIPILKFENDEPIHRLMTALRNSVNQKGRQEILQRLAKNSDMKLLLDSIQNGEKHKQVYQGADEIFQFLKGLNDLVRLSRELDIEFPFQDYDEIHELPVIEVEFAHLRETEQTTGKLTLLDTPGPNESDQPHLRKMLKEQMSKASAVLAILDFTQLKSDADAEVRRELREIANITEGRLYTLVNKFDQKDRHGDDEQEVKNFVADTLMEGHIRPDAVFPVSARKAYLANRVRHELFVNKQLPDPQQNPWVVDFCKEAFGDMWDSCIDNPEMVKKGAEKQWEKSLFHAPLEGVIRTAHARAAGFAIDAAAAKLVDLGEKIDNLLNIRETALTKSAKELQIQITALQADISGIEASEAKARKIADKTLDKLAEGTGKVFEKVRTNVVNSLDTYFKQGKRIELQDVENQRLNAEKAQIELSLSAVFKYLLGRTPKVTLSKDLDFDPADPVMKFSDRKDAYNLVQSIENALADILLQAESTMKDAMDNVVVGFQNEFSQGVLTEAQFIISQMQERLKDGGFSVNLKVPNASKLGLGFSGSEMLVDVIEEKSKSVTRSRRKKGVWGTVCRWFGTSDWGWEEYKDKESFYEIDIRKIEKTTLAQIDQAFAGLDQGVAIYIKKPLNDAIDDFFVSFKSTVEQIRGDLLQSIRDQEQSKAEQDELSLRLKKLKQNVPEILSDSRALKQDVEPLIDIGG
ncbi:dynamin family protein [Methylomonas koyamae]|uniref:dynamin family protein n=1 Tax=Methylomonas koyamae TaxID=702114 RepID=UPI0028739D9C|nr:dynamin family protein [Methylomonas koyamae]WNB75767.1 dynamin family protein [Methylomonas koyamae]